uniref:DUF4939 domain-containing protein n=1 Tax=Sinocyclocheilus rhinocerous TaxID=307959 RepID=A0A673N998_9TELE
QPQLTPDHAQLSSDSLHLSSSIKSPFISTLLPVTHHRTITVTSMDPRPPTPTDVLEKLVNALRATLTPAPTPQSASVCPMAIPPSYAGDTAECGGFLLQVALFIEMQPQKFSTERTKVAFLISLLSSRALMWVKAIWNANSLLINSYEAFTNHFKEVFCSATDVLSVSDQLLQLGWNEAALLSAYRQGLDPRLHAQMAISDDNVGLENFMLRANRIAQRLSACHTHEAAHQSAAPAASPPVPEPMQMDSTRLTPSERARRLASGLCLYCAATDHYIGTCPSRVVGNTYRPI